MLYIRLYDDMNYRGREGNTVNILVKAQRERQGNTETREYIQRERVKVKLVNTQIEKEVNTKTSEYKEREVG